MQAACMQRIYFWGWANIKSMRLTTYRPPLCLLEMIKNGATVYYSMSTHLV